MKTIPLYELIHDENEKPGLIRINEFDVTETDYDEAFGIYIMANLIHLGIMENEHIYLLGINSKNEIIGIINIALGCQDNVPVYMRNIVLFLVLSGSKAFVDYHNHPNNIIEASSDDLVSEAHMCNIAKILEIEYLGSYILGQHEFIKVGDKKSRLIEEL